MQGYNTMLATLLKLPWDMFEYGTSARVRIEICVVKKQVATPRFYPRWKQAYVLIARVAQLDYRKAAEQISDANDETSNVILGLGHTGQFSNKYCLYGMQCDSLSAWLVGTSPRPSFLTDLRGSESTL
jgi:hypothetical protein